jgi:hypothetical protein
MLDLVNIIIVQLKLFLVPKSLSAPSDKVDVLKIF